MAAESDDSELLQIHANAVFLHDQGVLIVGQSGSGKSSLTLQLMAFGAQLVGDDRLNLHAENGQLIASAPMSISGKIEARGVGILAAKPYGPTAIALCVDMDKSEQMRLPPFHQITFADVTVQLFHGKGNLHLAAVIVQLMKSGRRD